MRAFLRGRPGPIVVVGFALILYGVIGALFLAAFAWGGLLSGPTVVDAMLLAVPAAISLAGIALVALGGYRCCRSVASS
jgi:hypothetical protein